MQRVREASLPSLLEEQTSTTRRSSDGSEAGGKGDVLNRFPLAGATDWPDRRDS